MRTCRFGQPGKRYKILAAATSILGVAKRGAGARRRLSERRQPRGDFMASDLKGKAVLITGASTGIGAAPAPASPRPAARVPVPSTPAPARAGKAPEALPP